MLGEADGLSEALSEGEIEADGDRLGLAEAEGDKLGEALAETEGDAEGL